SLLVWAVYGARLDGRQNADRTDDVDFNGHPPLNLSGADKRTVARWVDLGCPVNFPGETRFLYTDDDALPVIHVDSLLRGRNAQTAVVRVGLVDVKSGIDWSSLRLSYYAASSQPGNAVPLPLSVPSGGPHDGVVQASLPVLPSSTSYVLVTEVKDL